MNWSLVCIGAVAGVVVQLLNLAELPNIPKNERPDLRDPVYWIPYVVGPLVGGFATYVYIASEYDIKPLLALQIGSSAPLLLRAMASTIPSGPNPPPPKGDQ